MTTEETRPTCSTELSAIGKRLRTQDNRCTKNPMFIVQQKRSFGVEPGEGDIDVWLDNDWYQVDDKTAAHLDELDAIYHRDLTSEEQELLDTHTKRGIKYFWEFCMAAFTEEGCKQYLRLNGHNLTEPRIYAESWNRCPEMLAVRDFLMGIEDTPTP